MAEPEIYDLNEAAAEALSGTVDSKTGTKHQVYAADANSSPTAFAQLMNLERKLMLLLAGANRGQVLWSGSGLTVVAFALEYRLGTTAYSFPGEATGLALTANETNYVYLDSAQTLKTQLTAWPSGDHIKLAKVVTNATQVTTITNMRFANHMVGIVNAWSEIAATHDVDFGGFDADNIGGLGLADPVTKTLDVAGAIDLDGANTNIRVDTYGGAAGDNLASITTSASMQGRLVILRAAHADRTVNVTVTAITTPNSTFVMDDVDKFIVLMGDDSGGFVELARNYWTLSQLDADLNCNQKVLTNIALFNLYDVQRTISGGTITADYSLVSVDTEADAATDDLDTINPVQGGDLLWLFPENIARVVTVKDGTDNILLTYGDFVMNDSASAIALRYDDGLTKWVEVFRSFVSLADMAKVANAPRGIPYSPILFVGGALSVAVLKPCFRAPVNFTIKNVSGDLVTAPTGGACIVDVRVDGASIFTSQAEMINIADGTTSDTSATKNHAVSAGELITLECEEVNGSPADLSVVLNGFAAPQTPPG